MNPKKFGGLVNTKQESGKLPLPAFIEELYFKLFKNRQPDNVRSIEQMVDDYNKNKQERKTRRSKEKPADQSGKGEGRQQ